jgi:hypothetical protein
MQTASLGNRITAIQLVIGRVNKDALTFTDKLEIASQVSRKAGRPSEYNYSERESIVAQLDAWGL